LIVEGVAGGKFRDVCGLAGWLHIGVMRQAIEGPDA